LLRRTCVLPLLVVVLFVVTVVPSALAGHDDHGWRRIRLVSPVRATHSARAIHRLRVQRTLARIARERVSIVRYARRFLGVPYAWGGTSPAGGFDCSGFTRYVFAHFGVSLPHYTFGQFDRGRSVSRSNLRPGDLVFFDGVGHVGLYIGSGRFIHAPHSGARVSVASLAGWYGRSFDGARRVIVG
jgi:cell wall-associated NlpC family hydrolase